MWVQRVALGTPIADLWVNPVAWFGSFGAVAVTILLAIGSLVIGYPYVMKLIPGKAKDAEPTPEPVVEDEVDEGESEEETEEPSEEKEEEVEIASEDEADATDE